jgi:hypothetical protein
MKKHIIICGYSRAGTTLFYQIKRQEMDTKKWKFFDEERTFSKAGNNNFVVTKRPLDVFKFEKIQKYSKKVDVEILLCIRDPRSMLTSFHKSVPDDYFIDADYQYLVTKSKSPSKTNPGLIPIYYAIDRFLNSNLKTKLIKYEDVVLNKKYTPGQTPENLRRALNGDRELDKSRISAWKQHLPRLKEQFSKFPKLYDIMEDYGYDLEIVEQWRK